MRFPYECLSNLECFECRNEFLCFEEEIRYQLLDSASYFKPFFLYFQVLSLLLPSYHYECLSLLHTKFKDLHESLKQLQLLLYRTSLAFNEVLGSIKLSLIKDKLTVKFSSREKFDFNF